MWENVVILIAYIFSAVECYFLTGCRVGGEFGVVLELIQILNKNLDKGRVVVG